MKHYERLMYETEIDFQTRKQAKRRDTGVILIWIMCGVVLACIGIVSWAIWEAGR